MPRWLGGDGAGPIALLSDDALADSLVGIVDRVTVIEEADLDGDEIGQILEICATWSRTSTPGSQPPASARLRPTSSEASRTRS
jgi:hypothetical protein